MSELNIYSKIISLDTSSESHRSKGQCLSYGAGKIKNL